MLWIEWTARLEPPHDEISYRDVRTRLEKIGLRYLFAGTRAPMTGQWSGQRIPSEDRERINLNARVAWLQSRDVSVDASFSHAVHMLFEVATARDALETQVSPGSRGTFVQGSYFSHDHYVSIDGTEYPLAGRIPPAAKTGTPVIVDEVWPTWWTLRWLAEEYMSKGISSRNKITVDQVGLKVLWDLYRDWPPIRYP